MLPKPKELVDRDAEWDALIQFASAESMGATLALVYGRRRQGKTLLLELLAEQLGGFLFTGTEQSDAQNLADLSDAFAQWARPPYPVRFGSWEEAVGALLALGESDRPVPIILDEFPYLFEQSRGLPSIIQKALSPRSRAKRLSRTRLIVCGSAISIMQELLGGSAPLRGRASTELVVRPFGFRDAATLWDLVGSWDLALRVHALVGGTPAYLDFCDRDRPADSDDFDAWVVRRLINPASAMFREGRVLLAEDSTIRASSTYYAVLTAIAYGATRRGQIAAALGREQGAIYHALTVLRDAELIDERAEAFRGKRTTFHIAEPVLRFQQVVIRPEEVRLQRGHRLQVWKEASARVSPRIFGPHFEQVARDWAQDHASVETLGGRASNVRHAVVACADPTCPSADHEIDVVVTEIDPGLPKRVAAIGEAKWQSKPIGLSELDRLRHLRQLLPVDAPNVKVILFSRSGFTDELRRAAEAAADVELVDTQRLYTGE